MPRNIHLELPDSQARVLDLIASGLHRTPEEAASLLMEETLRHEQFPQVEFRDSILGRQAYIGGSGLAVWEFVMVAQSYQMDAKQVAHHFEWPLFQVDGVLNYYRTYAEEIDRTICENDEMTPEIMKQSLPAAIWND